MEIVTEREQAAATNKSVNEVLSFAAGAPPGGLPGPPPLGGSAGTHRGGREDGREHHHDRCVGMCDWNLLGCSCCGWAGHLYYSRLCNAVALMDSGDVFENKRLHILKSSYATRLMQLPRSDDAAALMERERERRRREDEARTRESERKYNQMLVAWERRER